ncbi:MAG: translation initiation factor IF-2 [Alphaproteobacteria bacterium]|nr:translation initiation factor IF-2 [Alphaproteobacteria bacterium]
MTDPNDTAKKDTLKVANPSRLSLTKTVESGKVKQNFTHGRSKTVTVEVRKTRTFAQGAGGMVEVKGGAGAAPTSPAQAALDEEALRRLSPEERNARLRVLKAAEERARIQSEEDARKKAEEEERRKIFGDPEEAATAQEAPEPEPEVATTAASPSPSRSHIVTAPKKAVPQIVVEAPPVKPNVVTAPKKVLPPESEEAERERKSGKLKLRDAGADRRGGGKITLQSALSGSEDSRMRSMASIRRAREKAIKKAQGIHVDSEKVIRDVVIPEAITVAELANRMAERTVDVIKVLMKLGMMVTAPQSIDADTAELVVTEFGHKFKRVTEGDVENVLAEEDTESEENLAPRPPVVTIMGHVDHGKTSLLDALRKTDVVSREAGGITQHIGAYQVTLESGDKVTFLDTPGHEAFTAMRARGAKITDIVVLVVAADDGVMEQTKEAISHAKAAGVPIIVAVNKIDKPGADSSRVKNELMQYELVPEEFGGDIMVVEVSAKTGQNLDKLVETILLQAEVLELKANPNRAAAGVVVEAKLDQGKGVVTTILIQKGTLRVGDVVVAGAAYGKVRTIVDDKNNTLKEAIPGMPVVILGLSQAPDAGDSFSAVENEKTAREIAEYRSRRTREQNVVLATRSLENLFGEHAGTNAKELPVIIKGDVQGSVEAIAGSLAKYSSDEVTVRVLHSGVGAISESDITLSKATGAMIIAFNVRAAPKAKELAAREKVTVRYYSIIYNVVDDVKAALSGMLSPTLRENFLGYAEIREVFNITKAGKVAGCMVTDGIIKRGCKVRLLRDSIVIHEGMLKTLKRFKDEVKEVKSGLECGMAFENYEDMRVGDQIECFEIEELARTV